MTDNNDQKKNSKQIASTEEVSLLSEILEVESSSASEHSLEKSEYAKMSSSFKTNPNSRRLS